MNIEIQPDGAWYHGSNLIFSELRANSTITQWKELAEAFSHQPSCLGYDDDGVIQHNGTEKGYLYIVDEPVVVGVDVYQHPRTTMDENAEFLTRRPLKVRLVCELGTSSVGSQFCGMYPVAPGGRENRHPVKAGCSFLLLQIRQYCAILEISPPGGYERGEIHV